MESITVKIEFPDLDSPKATENAQELLSELRQSAELRKYVDPDRIELKRVDSRAQDFGTVLVAVLGTPAVIVIAKAIKSWVERKGRTVIELNGIRIENVDSSDVGTIVKAIERK